MVAGETIHPNAPAAQLTSALGAKFYVIFACHPPEIIRVGYESGSAGAPSCNLRGQLATPWLQRFLTHTPGFIADSSPPAMMEEWR
jgi:hypothetical protein